MLLVKTACFLAVAAEYRSGVPEKTRLRLTDMIHGDNRVAAFRSFTGNRNQLVVPADRVGDAGALLKSGRTIAVFRSQNQVAVRIAGFQLADEKVHRGIRFRLTVGKWYLNGTKLHKNSLFFGELFGNDADAALCSRKAADCRCTSEDDENAQKCSFTDSGCNLNLFTDTAF
jgi:hypothetical protein